MKIITISGLDGSGKSTQIKLLKDYLASRGKRVFYFHAIKFSLVNKIASKYARGLPHRFAPRDGNRSITKANKLQIFLRKVFLKIDIWRFKKLCNQLYNSNYDYILSDRFFYDSLINIQYLSLCHRKHDKVIQSQKTKREIATSTSFFRNNKMTQGISNPNTVFYLQTDPHAIMRRDRIPEQGLKYLQDKKKLYDDFFSNLSGAKIINGNQEKEKVFEEIKKMGAE